MPLADCKGRAFVVGVDEQSTATIVAHYPPNKQALLAPHPTKAVIAYGRNPSIFDLEPNFFSSESTNSYLYGTNLQVFKRTVKPASGGTPHGVAVNRGMRKNITLDV